MILTLTPEPTSDAGADDEICISDGSYTISGSTSSNGTILWTTGGNGSFDASTTDNPTYTIGSETGSVTLTKTVSSPGSCADAVDFMVLTLTPVPTSNAGTDDEICISDGSYTISGSTSSNGTILWTSSGDGSFDVAGGKNPTYTIGTETGSVTLTKTVSSAGSCADAVDFMILTLTPEPASDAGNGGDECDYDFVLNATASAGTGTWTKTAGSGNALFAPNANAPNATVTVDAYDTYQFTWTEVNGTCMDNASVTVNFYEPPIANAGQDISLCSGEESKLNASGGVTYSWSPETGLSNSNIADPIVNPTTTTLYTLTITDLNGCSDQDTVKVTVNPLPDIDAGEDINICEGESVQLQASGEGVFQWDNSNILSNSNIPNPIASPNVTTTFKVILTDQNGCENFESIIVFVFKQPIANAGPDQELDYVFETTMEAELTSSESGEWSVASGACKFGNKNSPVSVVTGLSPGDNIFIWKVTNGVCPEATDEVKITVNDLLAPSVITPNGDNKNDYFVVRGIGNFDSSELIVFNRWGAEVYKTENYKNDWDGRDHNGNELPADTYFYVIKLVDGKILKGFIVIKR
jgi:gliding motility-associated-like protein